VPYRRKKLTFAISSHDEFLWLFVSTAFSGPGGPVGSVCVCLCDFWPRCLASWLVLTLSVSRLKGKVHGLEIKNPFAVIYAYDERRIL